MMIRFTAHCARDHDRVDFTDPKAFEAHCTTVHKARKIGRPSIANPNPIPWKAPKAPTTTEKLTAVLVKADDHGYSFRGDRGWDFTAGDWHTDEKVTVDRLEAGDTFRLRSTEYLALETDPEQGVRVQLAGDESKVKWMTVEYLTEQVAKLSGGDTVTVLKRAA